MGDMRARLSLDRMFGGAIIMLSALLILLFMVYWSGSKTAILHDAEKQRQAMADRVGERIREFVLQAETTIENFDDLVRRKVVNPEDLDEMSAELLTMLLVRPDLSEITFSKARSVGYENSGDLRLAPQGRGQLSVFREVSADGAPEDSAIVVQDTRQTPTGFEMFESHFPPDAPVNRPTEVNHTANVDDPTSVAAFRTPAHRDIGGHLVWSDLHRVQRNSKLPLTERRIEVTVQKAIADAEGRFCGVLRVGLFAERLGHLVRFSSARKPENDPHQVFLCDSRGGLITRITPSDRLENVSFDLMLKASDTPPEVVTALRCVDRHHEMGPGFQYSSRFEVDGVFYLATFLGLPRDAACSVCNDWIVCVVVPEQFYLTEIIGSRTTLLGAEAAIILMILSGGGVILRMIHREFSLIRRQTDRMSRFEFSPASTSSKLIEVSQILSSIEGAKVALRAMEKYVPTELVRKLYDGHSELALGSESREISVMFTDIERFTSLAEQLPSEELAQMLGKYLQVMTNSIHNHHGVIDKFMGDAVMALWNAPNSHADHVDCACEAALVSVEASELLFDSPEWQDHPRLATRYGIHCDVVSVGNFGAPDRMNFTAIGDGVNIASRLEGLNKIYGTRIIVSRNIVDKAGTTYVFRMLDRVAVKGKHRELDIFELVGRSHDVQSRLQTIQRYENALLAYHQQKFGDAIVLLHDLQHDRPSQWLARRCREILENSTFSAAKGNRLVHSPGLAEDKRPAFP